ncbi:hypothetical protein COO60DRAFT_1697947 [Scenedesmus sp. NREL 46B-D3]|nr:hypothetical protein COO60DRAFT_1697947 [Scenedesmus sp. NREL 46B-D3]
MLCCSGHAVQQVVHFGRCWLRWVGSHGGAAAIQESNYLAAAEPFVQAFLAGTAAGAGEGEGPGGRPQGAFQGVLLAVDVDESLVKQLAQALQLQHLLQPSSAHLLFSRALVAEGCCVWLRQGAFNPKGKMAEFVKAAAAYVHLAVQAPDLAGITKPSELKRVQGMHNGKMRSLRGQLEAAGLSPEQQQQRTVKLPPPTPAGAAAIDVDQADEGQQQDEAHQQQQQQQLVDAVVQQLGAGTPLADADPAFVFCFVSLPATGKSVLSAALSAGLSAAQPGGLGGSVTGDCSSSNMSVQVLNSDSLKAKKGITGMRYWHEVAGVTASNKGGGHRLLVLADKNLVPSPRDQLTRVADVLRKSGATSIAVLPTCSVDASTQQQQPPNAPQLPFPLEFLALSMLRVLQRSGHEGGLDSSAAEACRVVVQFGSYFRHLTLQRLQELLLGVFPHVVQLPVAAVEGGVQVPPAVLQHIADGLAAMQESGSNSSGSLPQAWEDHMRQLLSDPTTQAAVDSIALPMEDCAARLRASIHGIVSGAVAETSAAAAGDAAAGSAAAVAVAGDAGAAGADGVQYVGVAVVEEDQLRQQLQQLWEQLQPLRQLALHAKQQQQQQQQAAAAGPAARAAALEEPQAKRQRQESQQQGQEQQQEQLVSATATGPAGLKVKSGLHVTLWHRDDAAAAAAVRDALLACAGQEVQLQLLAVDTSPEVTAAQVELLAGPDSVTAAWQQLAYPHITLVVGRGASAADSNLLPARVADAGNAAAYRVVLPEPVLVSGQVLGFS